MARVETFLIVNDLFTQAEVHASAQKKRKMHFLFTEL